MPLEVLLKVVVGETMLRQVLDGRLALPERQKAEASVLSNGIQPIAFCGCVVSLPSILLSKPAVLAGLDQLFRTGDLVSGQMAGSSVSAAIPEDPSRRRCKRWYGCLCRAPRVGCLIATSERLSSRKLPLLELKGVRGLCFWQVVWEVGVT